MGSKELLAQRMEYWCNEGNLGYDQDQRWNIWEGGETDCSALALWCAWEAGYLPEKPTWGYSGSIASQLMPYGFYKVPFSFDGVRRGDILVNESHHVAIALGNGLLGQAGHDENWRNHGGQSGDQTGDETVIKPMYDYPWDFILRPPDSDEEQQPIIKRKRRKMECLIRPNGENYMVYFDGVKAHPLQHPDEMIAIQMCYKQCTGEDIPCFEMGTPEAPWATRLFEGAGR